MDELAQVYNKVNNKVAASYMQTRNDTFAIALHTFTGRIEDVMTTG